MPKNISTRTAISFTVPDLEVGPILRLVADKVQDLVVHAVTDVPYNRNRPRTSAPSAVLPEQQPATTGSVRERVKKFTDALLDHLAQVDRMDIKSMKTTAAKGGLTDQNVYAIVSRLLAAGQIKRVDQGTYALKGKAAHRRAQRKKAKKSATKKVAGNVNGTGRTQQKPKYGETAKKFVLRLLAKGALTGGEIGKAGEKEGRSSNAVQVELPKMMRERLIKKEEGPDGKNLYSLMETN